MQTPREQPSKTASKEIQPGEFQLASRG